MANELNYLDLFAGGGGLSEGFIKAGFNPVAHVEKDIAACFTLKTRQAFHWLRNKNRLDIYNDYLQGKLTRNEFYSNIPSETIDSVINKEISQDTISEIFEQTDELLQGNKIDLIIGGPPCQAYSLVGRARDEYAMKFDKRNYLYLFYADFLKRYHPKYFVFENVMGLLSAKDENGNLYLNNMQETFREAGYETEYKVLNANNYGVLQSRKRIILIGKQGKDRGFYPEPEKIDLKNVITSDVFSDLPELKSGEGQICPIKLNDTKSDYLIKSEIRNDSDISTTFHQARPHTKQDLEIYKIAVERWIESKKRLNYNDLPEKLKTHKNRDSFKDRFKVVAGDLSYSHTVVAHIAKDGHYYIHPDIKQNRSLTPRETARLQTFPDNYYFESGNGEPSLNAAFRQIGNAVPVIMAKQIATKLKEFW